MLIGLRPRLVKALATLHLEAFFLLLLTPSVDLPCYVTSLELQAGELLLVFLIASPALRACIIIAYKATIGSAG
tara:strand:- start:21543 stop:21764 length:222 start_codon:yes stop_codon:yes gene_type:complete